MADVVVLCPVLRRPHRVQPFLASLAAATPDGSWRAVFVATEGDDAEIAAVKQTSADLIILPGPRQPGDWARKVNTAYRATDEPLMLLAGDDVHFHHDWLAPVLRKVGMGFHVVGTNDLGSPRVIIGTHSTHPVVTRIYADEQGTIDGPGVVHEGYDHNFVDDELVGTAKRRQVWSFATNARVEHLHVSWSKSPMDDVYRLGRVGWDHDRTLFDQRRHLWDEGVKRGT